MTNRPFSFAKSASTWTLVLEMRRMFQDEPEQEKEWSWWKLFGLFSKNEGKLFKDKAHDSYNVYKKSPDFRNNYGWSVAVDGSDYEPLKYSGTGIYLVNLTPGSMMGSHVNPRATKYDIVLRGTGRIHIVFPNGTLAMDAKVREGDVFWVPRYCAFCQIASRSSPFVFFGFTTSSHKNRPQFLVGANSLLHTLNIPELATAFGVTEERMRRFIYAQKEGVILPSTSAAPNDDEDLKKRETVPEEVI